MRHRHILKLEYNNLSVPFPVFNWYGGVENTHRLLRCKECWCLFLKLEEDMTFEP